MLYTFHELAYQSALPFRIGAQMARRFWTSPFNPAADTAVGRTAYASAELFESVTRRYGKPDWKLETFDIGGKTVRTTEQVIWQSPWARVIQFDRDMADMRRAGKFSLDPAVLIVAPLSGHYATLLRGTVEAFLPDHAVFIVDWVNARNVSVLEGRFDFHDYIDHIIQMLAVLGPRPNVVAVCQPGPPVLAAAALMAEQNHPSRPASMTFMGSPIDARLSPTVTNNLAEEKPFAWFQLQHDLHRAAALSGRRAARLSGLRPAGQLHEHERRAPPGGPPPILHRPGEGRRRQRRQASGILR
jgi:poly(3-hydroxybutyrate) depolymerase